jgi:uncharacterized integral membrane protein
MLFLKRLLILLILALIFVSAIFFTLRNQAPVPLSLLVVDLAERPVAFWVLSAFVIGGITGMLTCVTMFLRLKKSELLTRRKLRQSMDEVGKLRGSAYKA